MRFLLARVYGYTPRSYKLERKGFKIEYSGNKGDDFEEAQIEISSLEELLKLVDELREPIIITHRIHSDNFEIEIYDDYRE